MSEKPHKPELSEGKPINAIENVLYLQEEISRLKAENKELQDKCEEHKNLNYKLGKRKGAKQERQRLIEKIEGIISRLLDNPPKRVRQSVIQENGWMGFAVSFREELKKGGEQ